MRFVFRYHDAMSEESLYWYGNVAKFEIANQIKSIAHSTDRELVVVDLGAGRGGDWDLLAAECPNVRICLWEPHGPTSKYLEGRFNGTGIEIHRELESLQGIADIGTSLSVLEHVDKKISHFQNASNILKKDGIFFMNFDDGHFRYSSTNIFSLREYRLPLAEAWRTTLSGYSKKLLPTNRFQKKVSLSEFLRCIDESDLELISMRFRHLAEIKGVSKKVGKPDSQLQFMRNWLDFETRAENAIAKSNQSSSIETCWELFATRTAVLKKAGD
jgi:hypothetical protein